MSFKEKYGPVALVAGASEGLGAAWSHALAKRGLDVVLIARKKEPLEKFAAEIAGTYKVKAIALACDLGAENMLPQIQAVTGNMNIGFVAYNAALPYIGHFEESDIEKQIQIAKVNIEGPIKLTNHFGKLMLQKGKGGIVLMSSLAGFQGSGYLTGYAASKAHNRIFAESLWYEWKDRGVDVMACIAGATDTPNYQKSKPADMGFFAPQVQEPGAVVEECLKYLGRKPSHITGFSNRLASFFMSHILTRKAAIMLMGDTTRKMYGIK